MASRSREDQARVKRCGKSAPGSGASRNAGKPRSEQGQIEGRSPLFGAGRGARPLSPGRLQRSRRRRRDQRDGRRAAFAPRHRIRLIGPLDAISFFRAPSLSSAQRTGLVALAGLRMHSVGGGEAGALRESINRFKRRAGEEDEGLRLAALPAERGNDGKWDACAGKAWAGRGRSGWLGPATQSLAARRASAVG